MLGEDQNQSVALPEKLREQFAGLERRLWNSETTVTLCWAFSGLVISYLILFVSDRFWTTPVGMRILILAAGLGVVAGACLRWAGNWIIRRRDWRALSVLVQRKYRRLGDRLLGIVELADESKRPPHFSPELYRAAIRQVAADAAQYDFQQAINLQAVKTHLATAGALVAVLILPALLTPAAARNVFARWIAPSANIARYTLVRLAGLPSEKIVAHGEPFEVNASVEYRSFWRPSRIKSQFEKQPYITASVANDRVSFKVPPQIRRGVLKIQVGDAKHELAIVPTHRPVLKELSASIALPEYLQYPEQSEKIQNGTLTVLEGSRVSFHGQVNRRLSAAHFQIETNAIEGLALREDEFSSPLVSLDGLLQCEFTWRDELGLEGVAPWRLALQTLKDAAPIPEIPELSREIAMLYTEVLDLKALAHDDFGISELGLSWEVVTDWQSTNHVSPASFQARPGTPREKKFEHHFRFSPTLVKVPMDSTVEVRAYAKDFFPNREFVQSPVYRIQVLGTEAHAELIRQKLESLLAKLEEVTRLEEKITESTGELKELTGEKLAKEKATESIAEAKDEQKQNAATLEQLAKEGAQTLREAVRNPTMPAQTLRDWAKTLQEMQQMAQGQMQDTAKALQSAEKNQESRQQDLAKAAEKEEEILQSLQQMQKQVNQGLDDLQALTLAQRLRKISSEEKRIEAQLEKNVPDTIGMMSRELPAKFQRANRFLAGDQTTTQQESEALQGEISRFFERTRQESYGEVSREMADARPGEELDKVRSLIEQNISMEAIQNLGNWAARFNAWADRLDPKQSSSGGGGGGGNNNEPDLLAQELMKQLLGLLRLRVGEINLRDRTQLLAEQKDEAEAYKQGAAMLSTGQRDLLKRLIQLQMKNPFRGLEEPLQEIYEPMDQAETLLSKAQTGAPTLGAEVKAINTLSDVINLINEQVKKQSNSQQASATAEEMAFLMKMMSQQQGQPSGMATGRNPGRNAAGGTTDQAATPLQGDATGKAAGNRNVNKASGTIENLPTEFREALERYFNGIEESEK